MNMPENLDPALFAPCGMNCLVCYVHLKDKKPCHGCLADDINKPERCKACSIKNCAHSKSLKYCYSCPEFPCKQIKNLEKSYTTRYKTSLLENSDYVRQNGLAAFFIREKQKWRCDCGGILSLHDRYCTECKKAIDS